MLRRYRSGVAALLVTGVYAVAVVVAAVAAPATGELGPLWWLTLFVGPAEGATVTWPDVLVPLLAGAAWGWALWQGLRGPLAGPPPELDRDTRLLRQVLYVSAAATPLALVLPSWPWWAQVLLALVTATSVVLFQPVLGGSLEPAGFARAMGLLGYGGAAALEVLDVAGIPVPRALSAFCALAGLLWLALILRAQRGDGRWRRATFRYGVAGMVAPIVGGAAGALLADVAGVYAYAPGATSTLMVIWLTRTAHELADPRPRPARPEPVPSGAAPAGPPAS
ncbi:hypothetical protein [Nonomuraea rhodomycinica]|uniref:Uncharacterized protein n=1 Tax=Nonomuraea rhodomycinica TaxID=1712872 RepID=A0A7Y6IZ38_9ACTN|nr:hypothetical protein [Nonomuraea rhodomycinica]NUW46800.1 hypothetical protein [Nonomuraea rhodomycinica]